MLNVEKCGCYDVTPMSDGRYIVACNNGNIGACIMDEEAIAKFRERCNQPEGFAPRHKPQSGEIDYESLAKALMFFNPLVLPLVYDLVTNPQGLVNRDEKAVKPIVIPGDGRNVRQFVRVSTGEIIPIPAMIGSTTKVKVLKDGTYEVTSKGSYYGAKEKTRIMTEEEFIDKFGK